MAPLRHTVAVSNANNSRTVAQPELTSFLFHDDKATTNNYIIMIYHDDDMNKLSTVNKKTSEQQA
jgi:hypothetical protein